MSEIAVTTTSSALNSWNAAMEEADFVTSPDLVKGKNIQMALVGIPMLITRMEFRKGVSRKNRPNYSKEHPNDAYVTITAQLPPKEGLRLDRVNMKREQNSVERISGWGDLPFDPESFIVINDGSTGIYRQCVAYLSEKGFITLKPGSTSGGKGESVYDSTPGEWADVNAGEILFDTDGFATFDISVQLAAKNGLRPSEYDTEFNPDGATTFYLA